MFRVSSSSMLALSLGFANIGCNVREKECTVNIKAMENKNIES
jgi:hypothetical protein